MAVVSSERVRPAPPCPAAHPARRRTSTSVVSAFICQTSLRHYHCTLRESFSELLRARRALAQQRGGRSEFFDLEQKRRSEVGRERGASDRDQNYRAIHEPGPCPHEPETSSGDGVHSRPGRKDL